MAEPSKELTVRQQIEGMADQFKAALPPHIPVERFVRIVLTAVNGTPALQQADRRSLFEAAMKCAADGLVPDGRDAAFVIYGSKVAYLPMIGGILKKMRNSGEIKEVTSHVVHKNDEFSYEFGDNEGIKHRPLIVGDRGPAVGAYAIIKTKDGGIYREFMNSDEIESVRNVSKAKDSGPWGGPFKHEMWRKTVLRRLSKRAPMSTDLEAFMRRDDDEHFDFSKPHELAMPKERVGEPVAVEEFASDSVKQDDASAPKAEEQTQVSRETVAEKSRPREVEKQASVAGTSGAIEGEGSAGNIRAHVFSAAKEVKTTAQVLIDELEKADVNNWEEVKTAVKERYKDITPDERLEVSHVMNRKNAQIYKL